MPSRLKRLDYRHDLEQGGQRPGYAQPSDDRRREYLLWRWFPMQDITFLESFRSIHSSSVRQFVNDRCSPGLSVNSRWKIRIESIRKASVERLKIPVSVEEDSLYALNYHHLQSAFILKVFNANRRGKDKESSQQHS